MNNQDDLLKMLGIESKVEKRTFEELLRTIDKPYIEEIFETGFESGAFNRANNRNVVRYDWKGKTYMIVRFET